MRDRKRMLAALGLGILALSAPAGPSVAEELLEEGLLLVEEGNAPAEAGGQEEGEDSPAAATSDPGLVIEAVDIVSSGEPSKEEQKLVNAMDRAGKKREARARKEAERKAAEEAAKNPIPEFHVNPLDYPPANFTENACRIYEYLTEDLELSHAAACGVLANIHLESSFVPLALGDGGTSYGICQWHLGRFQGLISYCNANGLDYNTLEGQLAYMRYELENGYSDVLAYLREVPDTQRGAYDAAYHWCIGYEKPDDLYYRGARRGNLAATEYFPQDFSEVEPVADSVEAVTEPLLVIDGSAAGFALPGKGLTLAGWAEEAEAEVPEAAASREDGEAEAEREPEGVASGAAEEAEAADTEGAGE